ncbi:hypothetical protein [Candidatus Endomicrobiellum trichonymphae]|uniref:hypothetical protein n=1 Tax=Endomicrobium trichonymphae TaxID=1408204 RepID=UPI000323DFC0|nr:hypothetical protein [Candidatus Endomicrobium trichonymphae]
MNGVFVNPAISSGKPGLIFGETVQFISQIEGIGIEYLLCSGIASIFMPLLASCSR